MPDRRRLIDAVCGTCKQVLRREDADGYSLDEILQTKAEIVADGLIPFDYFTDHPKPITGHAGNCQNRPH